MLLSVLAAAWAAEADEAVEAPPDGAATARAGHVLSVVGEVVALTAPPLLAAGTTGATFAAIRDPSAPLDPPWNGLLYTGLALAAAGAPLTVVGAEIEAAGRRRMGQDPQSHGDVGAWVTYGVAVTTMVVALPVSAAVARDNPSAAPIVMGSAGVAGATLWFCSVGLGAGYRGSLRQAGDLVVLPTGRGAQVAMRF
jgi:hypothetical protein